MTPTEYIQEYHKKYGIEGQEFWPTYEVDKVAIITLIKEYNIHSVLEVGVWKGWTGLAAYREVENVVA